MFGVADDRTAGRPALGPANDASDATAVLWPGRRPRCSTVRGLALVQILLLAGGTFTYTAAIQGARAQSAAPPQPAGAVAAEPPVLRVLMSSLKLPIAGQDIRLLVAVEPGSEPEAGMRLIVRGAPPGARLSHGKPAGKGDWVIERIDIPELDITLPAKAAGPVELHLDLNSKDGRLLASKSVGFVIETAASAATPGLTAQSSAPSPVAAAATIAAVTPSAMAAPAAPTPPAAIAKIESRVAAASAAIETKPASQSVAVAPSPATAPAQDAVVAAIAPSKVEPAMVELAKPEAPAASVAAPAQLEAKASDPPAASPRLAVRQPDPAPAVQATAPLLPSKPAVTQTPGGLTGKEPRELALGKATLATGNIAAARMLLTRAAEAGSAEGALLLGSTYDVTWLQANGAKTVVGNREQALRWYKEAQKLGAPDAAARIASLPAN
jgi:hypothetical protein